MKAKLLTDEALRDDLYIEMMYTAGSIAMLRTLGELDAENVRRMIEEQINLLMPVVKRHIKRHKRALKEEISGRN